MKKEKSLNLLNAVVGFALILPLLLLSQRVFAETTKPNVESFFEDSRVSEVKLSPDSKHVAMLVQPVDSRVQLGVLDAETGEFKIVGGYSNVDVYDVNWVNNERLTFSVYESEFNTSGQARGYPGLFAVNVDGSHMMTLISPDPYDLSSKPRGAMRLFDVDRSNSSNNVFVLMPVSKSSVDYETKAYNLLRLDTTTGKDVVYRGVEHTFGWLIDQSGVPRLNIAKDKGVEQIFYLDPANGNWRKIAEFKIYGDGKAFNPQYFGPDGTLYVTTALGRDENALYKFDFLKNAIDPEPIVGIKGYDFDVHAVAQAHFGDNFIVDPLAKRLLGVNYQADASATLWFDEGMKKIQKTVDALLPNTINMLSIGRGGRNKHVLVRAFSDVQPVMYFLYDADSNKITLIGKSKDHIDPKQMSQQDMVHIKARDGLDIPAYLTLPRGAGKKNLPMVVLVHGGPYIRGAAWGWDPEVQFLASRGYVVLQPEYRGSDGFGQTLLRAGFKQWGLAMQDDIADSTKWAIEQGYADPNRICIAGASYGGYATLMGLARNPELFRCGIEWVGVTDINLMFKESWNNNLSAEWRNLGMPVMVGDPVKDADMIKANSPVNIPQKITQPLLMAYGGSDFRVPLEHGEKMRDALKPYNKNVEWIKYSLEGHGWSMLKDNVDFWTHVEKFLDANIGKAQ